ncbi:MAG: hypothetical protein ACREN6_03410, partial [Gemmatimonadaceae bacterium]
NSSDPFGLKVCFNGSRADIQIQKMGTEEATNTNITLGDDNCVQSYDARAGKGYEELQDRFGTEVSSSNTYNVRFGARGERYFSGWDPSKMTAVIVRSDVGGFSYQTGSGAASCALRPGVASATLGSLIAHELLGHGLYNGSEISARRIENLYHAARGEQRRCDD